MQILQQFNFLARAQLFKLNICKIEPNRSPNGGALKQIFPGGKAIARRERYFTNESIKEFRSKEIVSFENGFKFFNHTAGPLQRRPFNTKGLFSQSFYSASILSPTSIRPFSNYNSKLDNYLKISICKVQ